MIVSDPSASEYGYVLDNLREKSFEELTALGGHPDGAKFMISQTPYRWVVYSGNFPAAVIGWTPMRRGVLSLFGFGTDDWVKVWRKVTLIAMRDMITAGNSAGWHRAQAISPAWHEDTHRWLRLIGATHEVELPAYGVNAEDFKMFSWFRK